MTMYQAPFPTAFNETLSKSAEHELSPHRSATSVFKRFLDVIGSLVGIFILALVYVPVAIAIKLDSPGPVMYSQERYGLQGAHFQNSQVPLYGREC